MTWIYTYICTKGRHVVVLSLSQVGSSLTGWLLLQAASRWQMETDERSSSSSSPSCSSYSPLPPSITRLWRPSAQRNLRNQWSNLNSCRKKWASSSFSGRSHANSLVNAYLSQKYMPSMELGVLSDMPDIRKKACLKLFKQQESHRSKLLSSYREMVSAVAQMLKSSRSMRCYVASESSSLLVQFSNSSNNKNDTGDGSGIPVYTFWSIASFEQLAEELVEMFVSELNLKRLLVAELMNLSCEDQRVNDLSWSNELYPGEFDELSPCNLYPKITCQPACPGLMQERSDMSTGKLKSQTSHEILQVYLTTWLAEANINGHRVEEIFAIVGEEMHVSFA